MQLQYFNKTNQLHNSDKQSPKTIVELQSKLTQVGWCANTCETGHEDMNHEERHTKYEITWKTQEWTKNCPQTHQQTDGIRATDYPQSGAKRV